MAEIENNPNLYPNRLYKNYYNVEDIELHSTYNDCWISIFGKVLDLSELIIRNKASALVVPILQNAGKDLTHWFDAKTKDPKTKIDIDLGKRVFYTPEGRYLHVPPATPLSEEEEYPEVPWWKDESYVIGRVTGKSRWIRVINTLTHQEETMKVPSEETINEILERYMDINKHAKSYTWKDINGKILDMEKNLEENGIVDEDGEYDYLDVPDADRHIPAILIYFDDDLTTA